MWNGIGWYGFIGGITTSTTDISLVIRCLQYSKEELLSGKGKILTVSVLTLCLSNCCRLLINFANSLDPDQARQNVGPDQDPNCFTL